MAHVIIDGGILKDYAPAFMHERMLGLFPDEIAENYLALHRQHRQHLDAGAGPAAMGGEVLTGPGSQAVIRHYPAGALLNGASC